MTALDIGAHHGIYTLLMSKLVGPKGKVIAFEPSVRESRRLEKHIFLNRCLNVSVQPYAIGKQAGWQDLYLVEGIEDWCNSLRPPMVAEVTTTVPVRIRSLDDSLALMGVSRVNFIKLDVEGAELEAFQGAYKLLHGAHRPVILAEVQDVRTRPWGYEAREIVRLLANVGYQWHMFEAGGFLRPICGTALRYDGNLVALPAERVAEFQSFMRPRIDVPKVSPERSSQFKLI
jgi:FkbM family methyltransferase